MQAELSPEDSLRLNVLLAGNVQAVRIDEGSLTLYALTPKGEAKVVLHRNCRPDLYVQRVRELLGGHAMGSPGGYPVHLMRWTSMGQASPRNLEALLKLGEPEAVKAVAQSPSLSDELARRAWWALPTMAMARYLLVHASVRAGAMGPLLADFLIEHLAFEEDPIEAMNSIRAVVGADLLESTARMPCRQSPGALCPLASPPAPKTPGASCYCAATAPAARVFCAPLHWRWKNRPPPRRLPSRWTCWGATLPPSTR